MTNFELERYINELIKAPGYNDMCPNGLQVEGKAEINKIVTGVTSCVELFDEAIKRNADAILTHHGLIWEFERPLYRGAYRERIKLLLENDINLYGFHLPLDGDLQFGNNALIAKELAVKNIEPFAEYKGSFIGVSGMLNNLNSEELFTMVREKINPDAIIFPFGPREINSIGIISGGAQKEIKQAVFQQLDVFLTGEVSEHIYHYAKEEKINFIAAGHHATEIFGIRALGEHIADKFNIDVEFLNIHNPV